MAEVTPARAPDPAARPVSRTVPDNSIRTAPSVSFRSLFLKLPMTANPAQRPTLGHAHSAAAQTGAEVPVARGHGRPSRDLEHSGDSGGSEARAERGAVLDPLLCQMAVQSGIAPAAGQAVHSASAALPLRDDLQNLLTGLARRVAWGGDRRKGSARIELSEGALAGATLVVHTEQRSVSVELELPAGAPGSGLEERLRERLEARGFSASVRVG